MSTKKCIIIHGCPSTSEDLSYNKHWMPWTKKQLIEKGIETETPLMPSPWQPVYEDFKKEFEKLEIDENAVLVGHSCGCAFLVRRLGETKKKISKLILVAPWKICDSKNAIKQNFYGFTIDKTIKNRVKNIIMFTSNNEAKNGKESLKIFHNALGGKIINLENHGHYCLGNMGTEKFIELLEEITNNN